MKYSLLLFCSCFFLSVNAQVDSIWNYSCDFYEDFEGASAGDWVVDDRPKNQRIYVGPSANGTTSLNHVDALGYDNLIRAYKHLSFTLNDYWKVQGEFEITSIGTTDPLKGMSHFLFGLSEDSIEMFRDLNRNIVINDVVGLSIAGGIQNGLAPVLAFCVNGQFQFVRMAPRGSILMNQEYKFYTERLDSLDFRVTVENLSTNDTVCDSTVTIGGGLPLDLPYFQSGNNPTGWVTRTSSGWVDNFCITDSSSMSNCLFQEDWEGVSVSDWIIQDLPSQFVKRSDIGMSSNGSKSILHFGSSSANNMNYVSRVYRELPISLCSNWSTKGDFRLNTISSASPSGGVSHFLMALTADSTEMIFDMSGVPTFNDMVALEVAGSSAQNMSPNLVINSYGQVKRYQMASAGLIQLNHEYSYYLQRSDTFTYRVVVQSLSTLDTLSDSSISITHSLPIDLKYFQSGRNPASQLSRYSSGWVDNLCIATCYGIGSEEFEISNVDIYYLKSANALALTRSFDFDAEYSCINLSGQVVISGNLRAGEQRIYLNDLPFGVYLIRIQSQRGHYLLQKFIVY